MREFYIKNLSTSNLYLWVKDSNSLISRMLCFLDPKIFKLPQLMQEESFPVKGLELKDNCRIERIGLGYHIFQNSSDVPSKHCKQLFEKYTHKIHRIKTIGISKPISIIKLKLTETPK